ncbi:MAG: 2OG-Fe(II) oxygenase [Myxococcota bacterium]
MSRPTRWTSLEPVALGPDALAALCRGEVPAIRVPGLLSAAECASVVQGLPEGAFTSYARTPAFQAFERFGIAQAGYGTQRRDLYFEHAVAARAERDRLISRAGVDPLGRAMERIRTEAQAQIEIAREPDGREYFAGILRRINGGIRLHADTCRRTDPRWQIYGCQAQLSLNVYLTDFQGGTCVIYERLHEAADDDTVPAGSYIYDRGLVSGARQVRVAPQCGDLLLFNSRCYHEVEAAGSDRLSYAAFVGLLSDRRFLVWA